MILRDIGMIEFRSNMIRNRNSIQSPLKLFRNVMPKERTIIRLNNNFDKKLTSVSKRLTFDFGAFWFI